MTVSQNGWPAHPDPGALGVIPLVVHDVAIQDGVRAGDVETVLDYVAAQFHRRVEPLRAGQCWGYRYRPVSGGTKLSNHASATAVDLNAPAHPLGAVGTFTRAQVTEIRRILAEVRGVVRWGGDYVGRRDEMHFEINAGPGPVREVARSMQILDYSAGYPGAQAVKTAGFGGVIRYLRKEGTSSVRPITAAEYTDMVAHGRLVALVYQHVSRDRVTEGRAAGRHDATWARAQALALGVEPRCIYFAVDFDAIPATVAEYFRGCTDVLGLSRVGAYGGYRVLSFLFDSRLVTFGWQTVAWSGGRRESRAHLFQRLGQITVGGISCDVNDVLRADFGQIGDEDMPTADEIATAVWDRKNWHPDEPAGIRARDQLAFANKYANLLPALAAAVPQILAAVTNDPDITKDEMVALLNAAVAEHTPTAEQIAHAQLAVMGPVIGDAVERAVRDAESGDNQEVARLIVRYLGESITAGAGQSEGDTNP